MHNLILTLAEDISTHASLAGRDEPAEHGFRGHLVISTHASLAGRDNPCSFASSIVSDFNPRVPCGTRQKLWRKSCVRTVFQPTRPLRDATPLTIKEVKQ